jgi:hypothetical protein
LSYYWIVKLSNSESVVLFYTTIWRMTRFKLWSQRLTTPVSLRAPLYAVTASHVPLLTVVVTSCRRTFEWAKPSTYTQGRSRSPTQIILLGQVFRLFLYDRS